MPTKKGARRTKPQPHPLQTMPALLSRGEVMGVILIFLSAITLLSLLTSSNGVLTATWLGWLGMLFGVGMWAFPVVTGVLGLWMMIRAFEKLPDLPWQRPAGLVLLFVSLIMAATLWDGSAADPVGGQVGLFLAEIVASAIGLWGAWAAATFLAVSGFVLLTDRLVVDLYQELLAALESWRADRGAVTPSSINPAVPLPLGLVPWWKRFRERWLNPPTVTTPAPPPSLVRPDPEPARAQPARPTPTPPQSMRLLGPQQTPMEGEMPPPRIVGGEKGWQLPRLGDMLKDWERHSDSDELIRRQGRAIQETLALFGVPADFEGAYKGPSVTQYLIKPGYVERTVQGETKRIKVKVSKIAALSNDLALALAAPTVRIEAPIPGTGYVGVEVPNQEGNNVGLKELMESDTFQSMKARLRIALGEDVKGQPVVSDLARMPHLLIAGATGTGKSVCINSIIGCLLLTHTPETLRLLMVDPKMVELSTYNGIPHLLSDVVTEVDKAAGVLFWAVKEMERRYGLFSKAGARDLVRYNDYLSKRGEKVLPYIVIVVDEMADLMMAAPEEVEKHICRLAQMARAVGIHLIIATQRPSVDVITGLIKANFPSRIAFAVTSQTDSRVILDTPGAERLLGRGDMLFMAPDAGKLERLQGAFLSDEEINRIVRYWKGIRSLEREPALDQPEEMPAFAPRDEKTEADPPVTRPRADLTAPDAPHTGLSQPPLFAEIEELRKMDARDELFDEAARVVVEEGRGSVSLLQRKLRVGYNRAARLVDQLVEAGVLSANQDGALGRALLAHRPEQSTGAPPSPQTTGGDNPNGDLDPKPRIWM